MIPIGAEAKREWRYVLKDVSLEVRNGEIVCVLGRDGSGKTTLIRIISTLIDPDSGESRVCGFNTVTESNDVKKCLDVMLNSGEGGFHARLSAFANLEYYAD
jgi:ABC-2 type transport system ATP-binding protein